MLFQVIGGVFLFVPKENEVKADASISWYDSSWLHRKAITINGSTAGAQTNYQVSVPVTYSANMKADFSDVRFTDSNGTTLLNHWLESKTDSSSANFWVKIPSIPASPNTTTIYLYYGNSSVSSTSDGTATFTFFDDFSNNTINVSSWPDNAENPIFTPGLGSVIKKDGTYYLFYDAAYNGTQINVATSSNGTTFTPDSAHSPVLSAGEVGAWDHNHIGIPYVFLDNGVYYMTYRGDNGSPYIRAGGLAYSTDLVTWTKNANNPYLSDTEEWVPKTGGTLGVEPWGVIKDGDTYYQFYSGFGGTTRRIGLMTTTDTPNNWSAASFTKDVNNPIFGDLNRCMEVFKYGSYFYGIVVYDASSLLLYRDILPTFHAADREYVGIIKNGAEITSWTDGFPDVANVLVDDVGRNTFPDNDFKTYYAGEVDGTHWKQGLMQIPWANLPAALSPTTMSQWTTVTGGVTVSDGKLILTGTTGTRGLVEQNSSYAPAFQYGRIISRFKTNNSTPGALYPLGVRKSGDDTNRIALYGDSGIANRINLYTGETGLNTTTAIDSADLQNWHTWELTWKSGEVKAYQDGILKATNTTNVTTQSAVTFLREGPTSGGDAEIDFIAVGKYVFPEPTLASFGSEEFPDHLTITGTATQTAGTTQTITLTAKTNLDNIYATYTGDRILTLSGPTAIGSSVPTFTDKDGHEINFGSSGTIHFANGVATTDIKLYKTEDIEIDATDGTYSTAGDVSYDLNVSVVPHGIGFVSPAKPNVSSANVTINNGNLNLTNLPTTITQIAISTSPDFTNSSWEDISKKDDLLKQYTNTDTLYIKFRTQEGGVSDTIIKEGNNITKNEQGTVQNDINDGNTDTNDSSQSLQDGDIVKTPDNPDIYVIKYKNNKQYKRLLLSPTIFNSYLHLKWNNIKTISQQQLDQYQTSNLVKETTDTITYTLTPNGDTGKRKPLNPSTSYDPDSIYEINKPERDSYELED